MPNVFTDLQLVNLAAHVAYLTDASSIATATDGQWVLKDIRMNPASGYEAVLVYNASLNTYALLNAGTNDGKDLMGADVDLLFRNVAKAQLDDAVDFAQRIGSAQAVALANQQLLAA